MDRITSRKNAVITHLRALGADSAYRAAAGEFLCDGYKLLDEAVKSGAEITCVLWKEGGAGGTAPCEKQFTAPPELFDYASPMKNSPGPLFAVRRSECSAVETVRRAIVLENVQDPGNVGTVVRTANAFGVDAVILTGACADLYAPKTARATMGAIFRETVLTMDREALCSYLKELGLPLYGAALSEHARDIRSLDLHGTALAVGSEGHGLSRELLACCDETVIIPMEPDSESLNAAVAASVLMWEMTR